MDTFRTGTFLRRSLRRHTVAIFTDVKVLAERHHGVGVNLVRCAVCFRSGHQRNHGANAILSAIHCTVYCYFRAAVYKKSSLARLIVLSLRVGMSLFLLANCAAGRDRNFWRSLGDLFRCYFYCCVLEIARGQSRFSVIYATCW